MKKESADFSTNPRRHTGLLDRVAEAPRTHDRDTLGQRLSKVLDPNHRCFTEGGAPMIRATVDLDSLSVLPAKDVQSKSWKRDVLYRTWNVHCQYCKRESNKAEESKIFHDISVYPLSLLKQLVLWNQGKDQKDLNWHHNQWKCCSSCSQSQT